MNNDTDFAPTHNMTVSIKSIDRKMPVVVLYVMDGVATVQTRSGKTMQCNERALTVR